MKKHIVATEKQMANLLNKGLQNVDMEDGATQELIERANEKVIGLVDIHNEVHERLDGVADGHISVKAGQYIVGRAKPKANGNRNEDKICRAKIDRLTNEVGVVKKYTAKNRNAYIKALKAAIAELEG
jgi:polyhydroxyalkanoate synthesis regulator phasin